MFDLDKNKYEVKDKGTDFWGNRKYEITESPNGGGCGGLIAVIIIILLCFKDCGGNSDNSSQDTPTEVEEVEEVEEIDQSEESSKNNTDIKNSTIQDDTTYLSFQDTSQLIEIEENGDSLTVTTIENVESEISQLEQNSSEDLKIVALYDKYVSESPNSNSKEIIKAISNELDISKRKVKKALRNYSKI